MDDKDIDKIYTDVSRIDSTTNGNGNLSIGGGIGGTANFTTLKYADALDIDPELDHVGKHIIASEWFTGGGVNYGIVAVRLDHNKLGQYKVYMGMYPSIVAHDEVKSAAYIALRGAKIDKWEIAAAVFPQLDSQLFIS